MAFNVFTRFVAKDGMSNVVAGMTNRVNKLTGSMGAMAFQMAAVGVATLAFKSQLDLDANLKSLSAITGLTGKEFNAFKDEIDKSATSAKMFKGDMASAFEVVGSAKSELLDNAKALAKVTDATVILSKASGDDLTISAENLTGVMNQFNKTADESTSVINTLAAGSVVGAANISLINESMKTFGAVANSSNISLEESVALVEVLSKKNLKGAEAGTKLRGVTLKLIEAGFGYKTGMFNITEALDTAKKKMNSFGTAMERDLFILKTFGTINITAGKILLENTDLFHKYTKAVTGTNTAFDQAEIKGKGIITRFDEMVAAFKNFTTTTNENNTAILIVGKTLDWFANNMNVIIPVLGTLAISLGVLKVAMVAVNIAMSANPIGLVIIGIGALSAAIIILIDNLDGVEAQFAVLGHTVDFYSKTMQKSWLQFIDALGFGDKIENALSIKNLTGEIEDHRKKLEQTLAIVEKSRNASVDFGSVDDVQKTLEMSAKESSASPESAKIQAQINREEIINTNNRNNTQTHKLEIVDKTGGNFGIKSGNSSLTDNLAF